MEEWFIMTQLFMMRATLFTFFLYNLIKDCLFTCNLHGLFCKCFYFRHFAVIRRVCTPSLTYTALLHVHALHYIHLIKQSVNIIYM